MVSGGPYGLEDIVGQAGYARSLAMLLMVPLLWSLPTALMIGELASALPEEGGFYVWVRRALGPFWGFEEAWLSLAASIFDMAIYPALTLAYLHQLAPALMAGHRAFAWELGIVVVCVLWNLRGAYSVGEGSLWLLSLLLLPFAALVLFGLWEMARRGVHPAKMGQPLHGSLEIALLFVLWNTMGWDNASTIAREVSDAQRNYIRAMLAAVVLVIASYTIPVAIVWLAGIPAGQFITGAWVEAAHTLALHAAGADVAVAAALAVVAGGALTGVAMFNALTLSYARLPAAMARDGLAPRVLQRHLRNGVPWVAVLACAAAWTLVLPLALNRLLEMDIMLYGVSLVLEFAALIGLRMREPHLPRGFRIPGGTAAAVALSIPPALLVAFAIWKARHDMVAAHVPAIAAGAMVTLAGPVVYAAILWRQRRYAAVNG
jgi:amino acid transporter